MKVRLTNFLSNFYLFKRRVAHEATAPIFTLKERATITCLICNICWIIHVDGLRQEIDVSLRMLGHGMTCEVGYVMGSGTFGLKSNSCLLPPLATRNTVAMAADTTVVCTPSQGNLIAMVPALVVLACSLWALKCTKMTCPHA